MVHDTPAAFLPVTVTGEVNLLPPLLAGLRGGFPGLSRGSANFPGLSREGCAVNPNASSARRLAMRNFTCLFSRQRRMMSDAAAFSFTCGQMLMG